MLDSAVFGSGVRMRILLGAFGLWLVLAASANAQTSPTPAQSVDAKPELAEAEALAAPYELTNADATRLCRLTLEAKPEGPGFALELDRNLCHPLFGFLGEVAAWQPGVAGAILLVASDGRVVAEFSEGVGGVYDAIRENDAVYFLANLQFVDPTERVQVTDLYGEWNLSRPDGQLICRVTLTSELAGDELYAARIQPDCDPAIARVDFAYWQFERGDVVLRSATGETLRFERNDGGAWTKVPEKPQPLLMSRP